MDTKTAVTALTALAQGSRLAVFRHLVGMAPEGAYPGDIAQTLDIPANTLSFHLKALSHAGLIEAEQRGRFIQYRANLEEMKSLLSFLTENCCGGNASLCAPACAPNPNSVATKVATGRK
ncbi:MAG: ArsR/SmtB family transcription factor [Arenimonas sp.]